MRILGLMIMLILMCLGTAFAATVDLTNGSAVQGDIIKQDAKSIQINVDGVTMTYYADEIKDIDGKPFGAPTPPVAVPAAQPEAVAPVTQPDTVGTGPQPVPAASTDRSG